MAPAAIEGALLLDKPSGITSHDAVVRIRRLSGESRIGHAGTLDPLATGLLLLLLGRATRLSPLLTSFGKEYEGEIRLGVSTTTDDREGEPLGPPSEIFPGSSEIEAAVARLRGPIRQVPPVYSAKKRDGVPLHRLARRASPDSPPPPPPPVDVFVSRFDWEREAPDRIRFRIACSSGTYIRALARDLGSDLGCGGHLDSLRRTRIGPLRIEDAFPLAELTAPAEVSAALRPTAAIPLGLATAIVNQDGAERLLHGREALAIRIEPAGVAGGGAVGTGEPRLRVLSERGRLVAVAEPAGEGGRLLKPRIVFPDDRD